MAVLDPGFKPFLQEGNRDLAVRAAQNATRRALHAKGIKANNLANGAYGSLTKNDLNRLENIYGVRPVAGRNIDEETWEVLTPFLSRTDKEYLHKRRNQVYAKRKKLEARRIAAEKAERKPVNRLLAATETMWGNRGHLWYSMYQSRPFVYNPARARYYDCSATVSVIYYLAGCVDPNGLDHNGYGYTGTQWNHGRFVSSPQVGDLAFYGNMGNGVPSHVAIVISAATAGKYGQRNGAGWHVLSFGSNPMRILRVKYRNDFRGYRRYV